MNYNTMSKRKNSSNYVLGEVEGYDDQVDSVKKRGAVVLGSLADPSMDDYSNRQTTVQCAMQIIGSVRELQQMDNYQMNTSVSVYPWLEVGDHYLTNYAWGVDSITDYSGNEISASIEDVTMPWSLFCSYSKKRDRNLTGIWDQVYDDYVVSTRTYFISENIYGDVVKDSDVETKKSWGKVKSVTIKNKYQTVVKDTKTVEVNTSPEPILPKKEDFVNLVKKAPEAKNLIYWIDRLKQYQKGQETVPVVFDWLQCKIGEFTHDKCTVESTQDWLKPEATEKMNSLTDFLFFKQGTNFALNEKFGARLVESRRVLKPEYTDFYNAADPLVKLKIYTDFAEYYYYIYYKIEVDLFLLTFVADSYNTVLTAQSSAEPEMQVPLIKEIHENALAKLRSCYSIYSNNPAETRAEDYEPSINYPEFINYLKPLTIVTNEHAELAVNYWIKTVQPWLKKRAVALYNSTDDEITIKKLLKSLEKRMNKDTGTLMLWYQSVIGLDSSVKDLEIAKEIAKLATNDLTVARCCDATDGSLSKFQINPSFVDVEQLNPLFDPEKQWKKGDTVYLEDDLHPELGPVKITNVEKKYIQDQDFTRAQYNESTGQVFGVSSSRLVYRLHLDSKLPNWACAGNDVSSLRVMRIDV